MTISQCIRHAPCVMIVAFTLVACSGSGDKPGEDSAMANMPGMNMSGGAPKVTTEIAFTEAQIARGKVKWEPIALVPTAVTAVVPGQVVPNEDRSARIGAPASGRVMSVQVRPGEAVSEGQLLVTIQSPASSAARADLARAEADVRSRQSEAAYAKSARDRAERLLALKAISKQEHERALADDELARSMLSQSQSELERARSAAQQLGISNTVSGEIQIRSPLSGVVLTRTALAGTFVEAGAELVVVTDPASLWLSIQASEQFTSLFNIGGRLRFIVPAWPADTFVARVEAIGAGLDADARTLAVRGLVASAGAKLRPGMLASVIAEGRETVPAALLPQDAVQLFDGKQVVFIALPDGKGGARFVKRDVEVRSRTAGHVAVARGIAAGDLVVTEGAFAVKSQFKKGSMADMEM